MTNNSIYSPKPKFICIMFADISQDYALFYSSPSFLCIPLLLSTLCFLSFFLPYCSLHSLLSLSLCSLASLKSVPQAILIFPGQLVCCDVLFIQRFIFRRPWVDWTGRAAPPVKRSVSLCHSPSVLPLSPPAAKHTHTHNPQSKTQ